MKTPIIAVLSAAFVLATPPAFAHGAEHKAGKIDYSKVEETPFGRAADPKKAKRTITVAMSDEMRFTPAEITVKKGEVVRFAVKNKGKVMHEMVLGTMKDLEEHAELMKKYPGMEHDEPYMAHVAQGKRGTMTWTFTQSGTFMFGCLTPGHWEAGMKGVVVVESRPRTNATSTKESPK